MPTQLRIYKGYNFTNADSINAVKEAGIHHALVFVDCGEDWEWWNYGAVFPQNSPTLDSDIVYARDLGWRENRKLMALYPDRKYYTLRGIELREIKKPLLVEVEDALRKYVHLKGYFQGAFSPDSFIQGDLMDGSEEKP
jgi:hypothetical protein